MPDITQYATAKTEFITRGAFVGSVTAKKGQPRLTYFLRFLYGFSVFGTQVSLLHRAERIPPEGCRNFDRIIRIPSHSEYHTLACCFLIQLLGRFPNRSANFARRCIELEGP